MKKPTILETYNNTIEQNLVSSGFIISRKYEFTNCKNGSWKTSRINSIYIDDTNQNVAFVIAFFGGFTESQKNLKSVVKIYSYNDINDFEVKEDGQLVISGKAGSTLVGGALLGGVGALAGASGKRTAKNKCTSADIIIYVNDLSASAFTFNVFDAVYTFVKPQKDDVVREIMGILKYIQGKTKNENDTSADIREKYIQLSTLPATQTNIQNVPTKTVDSTSVDNKLDKWVTFVLCLFLGCLGVHKFYEKKIGMGIVYLLTMGLFTFGVLIDLIMILLKKDRYYTV